MTQEEVIPSRAQLYALLGVMLLFWSANFVFAKVALRELPSFFVVCLRAVLSGLFMIPVYAAFQNRIDRGTRKWTWADAPRLAGIGAIGVMGNQALFVIGLSKTSVAHASVITAMGPMFTLVGASLIGHERLSGARVAGMSVAAAGVVALQFGKAGSGSPSLGGDLILLVSVMILAAFTIFGKRLAAEFGSVTLNAFAFVCGGLLLAPPALWQAWNLGLQRVSAVAWGGVLYMALFPSVAGYLIYSYALRHLPASRVSSVVYLQPVAATALAAAFLREVPATSFAAAAALVLSGVYITERN